jgi:hypothetical protein
LPAGGLPVRLLRTPGNYKLPAAVRPQRWECNAACHSRGGPYAGGRTPRTCLPDSSPGSYRHSRSAYVRRKAHQSAQLRIAVLAANFTNAGDRRPARNRPESERGTPLELVLLDSCEVRLPNPCVLYLSLIWLLLPGKHLRVPNSARRQGTVWPGDAMSALRDRFGETRAG